MDRPVLFLGDGFIETAANCPAIGARCDLAPRATSVAGERELREVEIIPGDGGTRLLDEARAPGRVAAIRLTRYGWPRGSCARDSTSLDRLREIPAALQALVQQMTDHTGGVNTVREKRTAASTDE